MANLKNITELPMAESADGLNLIVNDNGAAKQIAASAVSVQADWNQNDPAKPDYVKNRPFYEAEDGEFTKSRKNICQMVLAVVQVMLLL